MRVLGIVSYKGTRFQGWQKQPTVTVQGEIEKALSQVLNSEVTIFGSGRTDAGVHAIGQTFTFNMSKDLDLDKLCFSINRMIDKDIKILSFSKVDDDFHARFSAKSKTYLYKIRLGVKDPFENEFQYIYPFEFDFDLFSKALKQFEGKHCFRDFTSKEEDEDGYVREIYQIVSKKQDNDITVEFTGNGFMRYQIRNMVGAALAVASKNEDLNFIPNHLKEEKIREICQYKAPPQGLYLVKVEY
ncbi:MAG: tRNA pseudouridine(38-40) synthase TruA [Bacilli bacterium]|nr:tRNA pseudouridine(38-40) synthase TruA [Bacilli bacterium]